MALHGSSPDVPTFAAFAQIVFTDVTGVIVGGSIPIPVEDRVTLVGTPNAFAHQRLMQAINGIVPDAGEPTPQPATSPERDSAYLAGFEPNEDGVIAPRCANGACGVD